MKNIAIFACIIIASALVAVALNLFVPGFENPIIGQIATSIIFGGFSIVCISLAFSKTEKQWATNLLAFVGMVFGGLLLSAIICSWLPDYQLASAQRMASPENYEIFQFKGRMLWLIISLIMLTLRVTIKKRFSL